MKKFFNIMYDNDGGSDSAVVAVKCYRDFAAMFNEMLKEFNVSMDKPYRITNIEDLNITMFEHSPEGYDGIY